MQVWDELYENTLLKTIERIQCSAICAELPGTRASE